MNWFFGGIAVGFGLLLLWMNEDKNRRCQSCALAGRCALATAGAGAGTMDAVTNACGITTLNGPSTPKRSVQKPGHSPVLTAPEVTQGTLLNGVNTPYNPNFAFGTPLTAAQAWH